MRHINKSDEPKSLKEFNKVVHVKWSDIHNDENQHVYDECLHLGEFDQEGLCGYTEVPLKYGKKHIDHYIKRETDPRLTFCWENMIVAIADYRYGANWKDSHIRNIDYNFNKKRYKNILNPVVDNFTGRFKFYTDGFMEPLDEGDVLGKETIKLFNLNEPTLMARRKNSMTAARTLFEGGMSKQDILRSLSLDGFISAVEYELSMI